MGYIFPFKSCPLTKLLHHAVLCSAVVELGIYLYEDEKCTITFCGVDLWAGLTGYSQKHVAALVH